MKKIVLKIEGMTCAACSASIEKGLSKMDGIVECQVNLVLNNASLTYDEAIVSIKQIENKIAKLGYKSLGREDYKDTKVHGKKTLIIVGILSFLIMYISMGHMFHLPIPSFLTLHQNSFLYSIILWSLTTITLFLGRDIFCHGFKSLWHKAPNMDTLVSLGIWSAYLYSFYNTYQIWMGHIEAPLYYESASMVIFFILLGKYLDKTSKRKTTEAIRNLVKLTPTKAFRKEGDKEKEISIGEVEVGDILVVKSGMQIAVDGRVTKGMATVNEALLTGESIPVTKKIGDKLLAGSIDYDGYLEYEAEKVGKDSFISSVVRLVAEASSSKAPIARLADKVSGYFVPIILCIAILSFVVWLLLGKDLAYAMNIFISVLVIACPCALGLATPLSIMVSTGVLASHGILLKKAASIENVNQIREVVFDKTGTLTKGTLRFNDFFNYADIADETLLQMIGSCEKYATHPLALSLVLDCQSKNIVLKEPEHFEVIPGEGIRALYDGKDVYIGKESLFERKGMDVAQASMDKKKLEEKGATFFYVSVNGNLVALLGATDVVREEAKELVSFLHKRKIRVRMLTGDNELASAKIAKELGISHFTAGVLPSEKSEMIRNIQKNHKVMMVGDGINDAPSLALADVAVAMGKGTDIASDSADVILLKEDLMKIDTLFYISERTMRNIKQNLFWAFFYNLLMIPLASGILSPFGFSLNPMIASFAMVCSSLTVILNALRLRKEKDYVSKM